MTTYFRLITLSLGLTLVNTGIAQSYKPNADGYISDPRFHQLMASEGYELVGFFDTLSKQPLLIGAKAYKGGAWNYIDYNGKVIPGFNAYVKKEKRPDPVINQHFDIDMMNDNVAVPPAPEPAPAGENPMEGFSTNTSDGKTGLMNAKKVQVLETKYERIQFMGMRDPYVKAKLNGLWGVYNLEGKEILPHLFTDIRMIHNASKFPEVAFQVKQDEKVGFYSLSGKKTVAPQFDSARDFTDNENLIEITTDNKKGLLDKTGKIILKPKYAQIQVFNKDGFAIAKAAGEKGLYTVIDRKGKEHLKPVYDKIEYIEATLSKVTIGNDASAEVSFFNMRTGQLIPGTYASIGDFYGNNVRVEQKVNGKSLYGIADSAGKLVLPVKYDYCEPGFRSEMIVVKADGQTGIVDQKGNWILKTKYDELALVFPESLHGRNKEKPTSIYYKENGLLGVIDFSGKVIIPAAYTRMGALSELYIVRSESLWGAIDLTGNIVIPIEYENLGKIQDGFFIVKKDGKRYKIDFYGGIIPE